MSGSNRLASPPAAGAVHPKPRACGQRCRLADTSRRRGCASSGGVSPSAGLVTDHQRRRRIGEARAMRLGIDYGSVATRAVLTWPDGRWLGLLFDGSTQLPSGVYLDTDATIRTGAQALHAGGADPTRYVAHPKRHLHQATVAVAEHQVQVVDLIAATLRRVGAEATRVAGQPVDELTLTVPASWGPRRRTALRP